MLACFVYMYVIGGLCSFVASLVEGFLVRVRVRRPICSDGPGSTISNAAHHCATRSCRQEFRPIGPPAGRAAASSAAVHSGGFLTAAHSRGGRAHVVLCHEVVVALGLDLLDIRKFPLLDLIWSLPLLPFILVLLDALSVSV